MSPFEFEQIKRDIENLKNERRSQKISEYKTTTLLEYHLNDREKKVFEYIKNNPGCNKQSVVDKFKQELSRNTIFKVINGLVEREYINEERDHHNRNTCKLFINERNIVVSVSKEIDDFRNIFLELLKNLNLANIQNDNDKKKILNYIDDFYSMFMSVYMFRALPAFTKMIDYKHRQVLYNIIYSNITLVLEEYNKFDNPLQTSYYMDSPLSINICTDDDDYDLKIEIFKRNGMEDLIRPLLERLHRINYRYAKQDRILT